ncbi:MAG: M23 family metallopeptidase [Pseudomonadota bacterium]
MSVSNAPRTDANRQVLGYAPFARVNNVQVLINPAPKSCLSSNFGYRNGRLHKGIDLQSQPAGPVVAAGAGTVVESGYRNDYGNYVLIQHAESVFTRYAHLRSITGEAQEGRSVQMGTVLGIMGNTASYSIPIHLHYEVLAGDYDTPKGAFGLTPIDILQSADR